MMAMRLTGLTAALLLSSVAANADVSISNKPTRNMSCDVGLCTATAQKAVLNVGELQTMLAGGDVAVKTGSVAKDISIDQPLTWTNISQLTLDAQKSVIVNKQVTVAGRGALTVITNDGGKHGAFMIVSEHGSVLFHSETSGLIINGDNYTLVGDIKALAADIATNPSGFYALAKPYNASSDGAYSESPIVTTFTGVFEGLGNAISNLTISFPADQGSDVGLFSKIGLDAKVTGLGLQSARLQRSGAGMMNAVGALAGSNFGTVAHCWSTGVVAITGGAVAGGLIGDNEGTVVNSRSNAKVGAGGSNHVGGLVGANRGTVRGSYAAGSVNGYGEGNRSPGGLVGYNDGSIENGYSVTRVRQSGRSFHESYFGGLVGENDRHGTILASYADGEMTYLQGANVHRGGLVGFDNGDPGSLSNTYWDMILA